MGPGHGTGVVDAPEMFRVCRHHTYMMPLLHADLASCTAPFPISLLVSEFKSGAAIAKEQKIMSVLGFPKHPTQVIQGTPH